MKTIEEKIQEGRQYRNLNLEPVEEENVVEGYATTFEEPYKLFSYETDKKVNIYEQVARNAFDECDMSDVIMQYDHEGRVFARLSNGSLSLKCDDHGLKIRADLSKTQIGRELYEEIKGGYTNKMSFGFTIKEQKVETTEGDEVNVLRTITKIGKLYDVSAVSLPANDQTEISARTFIDGVIKERELEQIRKTEIESLRNQIKSKGVN